MAEFPHDLQRQNDELRRFVKKVAGWDDLRWYWPDLQTEAYDLLVLYGHPEGTKPTGVIHA